jgi:hypothetical protein
MSLLPCTMRVGCLMFRTSSADDAVKTKGRRIRVRLHAGIETESMLDRHNHRAPQSRSHR